MALGLGLTALHLRQTDGPFRPPPLVLRVAHGLAGAAGLAVLWQVGAAGRFASYALVFLATAFVAGVATLVLARTRRGGAGLAMAVHGTIAIAGYVLLMAAVGAG